MRAGTGSRGYTILETMIFLAVSGLMFAVAATFINGKQDQVSYKQGMNDINTQIQTVADSVTNGEFPSSTNYSCSAADSEADVKPIISAPGSGSNYCTFLGKVIQFDVNDNPTEYAVWSIAGRQYVTSPTNGQAPDSFTEAAPTPIYYSGSNGLVSLGTLEDGLQFESIDKDTSGSLSSIAGFGFFNSFVSRDSYGTLETGSQSLLTEYIPGSYSLTESNMYGILNGDAISDTNVVSSPDIHICFKYDNSRYGILTIGGSGNSASPGESETTGGETTSISYVNTDCAS
jgi:type II secretory pathway pseudopilin PulG